jgi:GTPase
MTEKKNNTGKKIRHSGFVAIIGRPNVGKSTLLNYFVGEKIAGVSPKPQTTRNCVRGIVTREEGQILFLDTPGMHDPRDPLGNWMMKEASQSFDDADIIIWLVLPGKVNPYEEKILEMVRGVSKPVLLVINQIDRFAKPEILPVLDHYYQTGIFKELIPVSAKKGDQMDELLAKIFEYLPEGDPHFPEDIISDQNERFIVSELIREKMFRFTSEEVPYATAVLIDTFKERNERLTDIEATIIVEKDSQKAILIGKRGEMMREIGQAARVDIERFLGKKVFLKLWVKTMEHWKQDKGTLRQVGYE